MVTHNNYRVFKITHLMKNIFRSFFATLLCLIFLNSVNAEEVKSTGTKSSGTIKETAAGCEPGSASKYLDINNVRTLIYSYGNGWFLEDAEYEIPKGSKKTPMFSFSLWIGGIDVNNNLKLAAYRFGQGPTITTSHTKNDFWPGPLTIDGTAAIDPVTCAEYDKLFQITRAEVQEFIAWYNAPDEYPSYTVPKSIIDWPAHGDPSSGQAYYLAPFFDLNGDGDYKPDDGDYPYYDLANELCQTNLKPGELLRRAKLRNGEADDTLGILVDQVLKGDQTLWNVFNDKGNFHSETEGDPIGMEIRAQSFAFATNDEINNMTFYSYEIINRSTYTLTGTYFSQWVDPDLGYAWDDFIGCDVGRGLGYCYSGKPIDGTGQIEAYGAHPPAVGVDFFQGPYMDADGRDNPKFLGTLVDCQRIAGSETVDVDQMAINGVNFGDGIIDNERYGMRRFVYHNNGGASYMNDPRYAPEYYLLLRGIWLDGVKMRYGANAHPSTGALGPDCDFMFPGNSDLCDWGTGFQPPVGDKYWTEETANNNPSDRRIMQSAGPFTLRPGACNYITVGIPWARSIAGTPWESVELLRQVDDKCQALFDNCFAVLNGPNAPDLTIEELSNTLILYVSNRKVNDAGNNYQERYKELDPNIPNPDTNDAYYRFEGYQIFQLKDATVSAADLGDNTKSRLVAQVDIENYITKLVNWEYDQNIGGNVGTVMVDGENKGIRHSFVITQDEFATGDKRLINNKQYYFIAISYAYNQYMKYVPDDPTYRYGQKKPYLKGRSNIKVYTGIPHIPVGTIANSVYGDGPTITRIQGNGNGGQILFLDPAQRDEIVAKPPASETNQYGGPDYPIAYQARYQTGYGPLNIKVIDPLNVVSGDYLVAFDSMYPVAGNEYFSNANIKFGKWKLIDNGTGTVYHSDTTTVYPYEQMFLDLGLAVSISQIPYPGDTIPGGSVTEDNQLLYNAMVSSVENNVWLGGVADSDIPASDYNWIRSGTYKGSDSRYYDWDMGFDKAWDPNKSYQKILSGTWAPYTLVAHGGQIPVGPAFNLNSKKYDTLGMIASVDIVLTPDSTKWTRCPVIEMSADSMLSEGRARQYDLRKGKSVNINGETDVVSSDPLYNSNYISEYGMGWFPGYAINLETGERLNMMFAENSWLVADNGRDMIFNPTSREIDALGNSVFGGQHYIYVMGHRNLSVDTSIVLQFPAYDAGAELVRVLKMKKLENVYKTRAWASAMYASIPLAIEGKAWLSSDLTISIRVAKPYQRFFSLPMPAGMADTMANRGWPLYNFNTYAIATTKEDKEQAKTDLDLINVVPNPYYAYDDYERGQLDNRIKIVNLPTHCTVTIFDLSGTLIRQFNVDKSGIPQPRSATSGINTEAKTSIDWDLKNFAGIPISGGVYIIHVKSDGLGERTIKWFGILRPVDLNSL